MKRGQLHIHILFKFVHFTRVQLNYAKIKEKINTDLGLENVYMYNRLVRNFSLLGEIHLISLLTLLFNKSLFYNYIICDFLNNK